VVGQHALNRIDRPGTAEEAWATLKPYPNEHTVAWPVSTRVNTPRNNDAKLIEPA